MISFQEYFKVKTDQSGPQLTCFSRIIQRRNTVETRMVVKCTQVSSIAALMGAMAVTIATTAKWRNQPCSSMKSYREWVLICTIPFSTWIARRMQPHLCHSINRYRQLCLSPQRSRQSTQVVVIYNSHKSRLCPRRCKVGQPALWPKIMFHQCCTGVQVELDRLERSQGRFLYPKNLPLIKPRIVSATKDLEVCYVQDQSQISEEKSILSQEWSRTEAIAN